MKYYIKYLINILLRKLSIKSGFTYSPLPKNSFLILARPRTWSSNLSKCISLYWETKIIQEPIHPVVWLVDKVSSLRHFSIVLSRLYEQFDWIKHVRMWLKKTYLNYWVTHPDVKVIVLVRENSLKKAISWFIARQTWNYWSNTNNKKVREETEWQRLDAISEFWLKYEIKNDLAEIEYFQNLLDSAWKKYHRVTFEQLFEADTIDSWLSALEEVIDFLGIKKNLTKTNSEKLVWRFDPKNMRQSSKAIYDSIPNIRAIRKNLSHFWEI